MLNAVPSCFSRNSIRFAVSAAALLCGYPAAQAAGRDSPKLSSAAEAQPVAPQLSAVERDRYSRFFTALRAKRWDEARTLLADAPETPLRQFAQAELLVAPDSPKAELAALADLLNRAPSLPQAAQLQRLAEKRGGASMPILPAEQRLLWAGGSPRRTAAASVSDPAAAGIARTIPERIKNDDPAGAEQLLNEAAPRLSPAALTEWQQKVAWSFYIENDDANALRLGALAAQGAGEWAVQGAWVHGLAAWRTGDCRTATAAFDRVSRDASDSESRAAGSYWGARGSLACGEASKVQAKLRYAAANDETFYGLLAAEALGLSAAAGSGTANNDRGNWGTLLGSPNVRLAISLSEIGEDGYADEVLRHFARINAGDQHEGLVALARALSLPETQLYLAYNTPQGRRPASVARFPAPKWQPDGGWRVDPSLVFAHTLQESQFKRRAVSPAGAYGLMQVRPGTARDIARWNGASFDASALVKPGPNMALGQNYLEYLRDNEATGGLLPKVIAAYNAGPTPIARWNSEVRDLGDPLLFAESIPYWETRGYVGTVLRNYWMYQRQSGQLTPSATEMVQGRWPRFPTLRTGGQPQLTYRVSATDAN